MTSIAIYEMTAGITTWTWLCRDHVTARRASGWTVKAPAPLPDGSRCSDCERERQVAPGYVTPTVDYVRPDPGSRLPAPAEVARMPGVAPMAKPKQRKAA